MTTKLFLARETGTAPSVALGNLAKQCQALGISDYDVYGDFQKISSDSWLRRFEEEVADSLGMADAVFAPSGVMAQQIAMCVHARRTENVSTGAFLCHYSSHLLIHEHDSYKHLLNMKPIIIPADVDGSVQQPITYTSFVNTLTKHSDVVVNEKLVVIVECPHREIGGKSTPLADLQQISQYCRERGIAIHMDGARLWEAQSTYGNVKHLCSLFDSVYVSFYKGLGGMSGGAMLLSQRKEFCIEARLWLRRFGGNIWSVLPYAVSCWSGFRQNADISVFNARKERLVRVVAVLTAELNEYTSQAMLRFDPPVPEVSMIHVYIRGTPEECTLAHAISAADCGIAVFARIRPGQFGAIGESYFEFNMGPLNGEIPDEEWVRGYRSFLQELLKAKGAAEAA